MYENKINKIIERLESTKNIFRSYSNIKYTSYQNYLNIENKYDNFTLCEFTINLTNNTLLWVKSNETFVYFREMLLSLIGVLNDE